MSYLYIPIDPPYYKEPEPELNELGLPERDYYTTGDVSKILGLKPDTLRARFNAGYYPKPFRLGCKRVFTVDEIKGIINLTEKWIGEGLFRAEI